MSDNNDIPELDGDEGVQYHDPMDHDGDGIRDDHEVANVSERDRRGYKDKAKHKTMKPFSETAFGRTLAGRNRTGRTIHGIIDVLPVPNVHEIAKAVIKDGEARGKAVGAFDLVKETFKRLDWTRTIVGVLLVVGYILDWISIEKAEKIIGLLGGLFGG